jgi:hypothetical protein
LLLVAGTLLALGALQMIIVIAQTGSPAIRQGRLGIGSAEPMQVAVVPSSTTHQAAALNLALAGTAEMQTDMSHLIGNCAVLSENMKQQRILESWSKSTE